MNYLYLNNTRFELYCNFVDSLRRPQTKEISLQLTFRRRGLGRSRQKIERIFLWLWGERVASSEARQTPMRTQKYKATTRSARCSYGLFSKWVRAKASISSQNETSSRLKECAEGAQEEAEAIICRRDATNWDATGAPKRADLSLFRI
jgi:hypothetical protein